MRIHRSLRLIAFFTLCHTALLAEGYTVDFICDDKALKKSLTLSSQTLLLKEKTSPSALRRRAQNDKEKFEELAHYYGYYSAKVSYTIHNTTKITFRCDLHPDLEGELYLLDVPVG